MSVVASPRATKNTDLMSGKYDYIQAYRTTEVPTLERKLGRENVEILPLEGLNGAVKLGYSQVLFATQESLEEDSKREIVRNFLEATFTGWHMAIRDHKEAAHHVHQAQARLHHILQDEDNDHWDSSEEYTIQSVGLCCDYVKETFQGDKYGVIDPNRWKDATSWLLHQDPKSSPKQVSSSELFGLDANVWQPSPQLLSGNELARNMLQDVRQSALQFETNFGGRKPSLAVITVGNLTRYTDGKRRLQVYSNDENSWFHKTNVGQANNIAVKEIHLPEATTENELLSHLYNLQHKDNVDGIQLMWPLPPHINPSKMYKAISIDRDVDGAHYIGELELGSSSSSPEMLPPVTPMAVLKLMDHYGISVENKNVCVVGRSRIVGSPLAHMLRERDAIVTVAHSKVPADKLESLVKNSDIVIACAGSPGSLKTEWFDKKKAGSSDDDEKIIIHVGTTFDKEKDTLLTDLDDYDNLSLQVRYSPVPGGIGPLSVAQLFQNVVKAAWNRETSSPES
uniref:Methenyltetrahydrofolate cyclohydrolase n=1 Tax=Eucampia antarctica TaxID=49252 RepID=A0A7S2W8W0_9STRA